MSDDRDFEFTITISEGHVFRSYVDLMGKLIPKESCCLFLGNDAITIRAGVVTDKINIIMDANLDTSKLLCYTYESEEPLSSETISIQSIVDMAKAIGKQDNIKITRGKYGIVMEINTAKHEIKTIQKTKETFNEKIKFFERKTPTINVTCKEFCSSIKNMHKASENGTIRLALANSRLTMQAIKKDTGRVVSETSWKYVDDCESENDDEDDDDDEDRESVDDGPPFIDLPAKVAKDLGKLSSITSGVLNFSIPENGSLVISHSLGFGDNKIMIRIPLV